METHLLHTLAPVILLLAGGVAAAIISRELRLSSILGFLIFGFAMQVFDVTPSGEMIMLLAELGVVFLLFDIGLHFSLTHLREQARDVFAFGAVQLAIGTIGLGLVGLAFGLSAQAAFLIGATLTLSSTAVVESVIAERHQQNCPVGQTTISILIFQDIAAIFLLIVASAMGTGEAILPTAAAALAKAMVALAVAILLAKLVVKPFFDLVARGPHQELFTATALLVALTAAWTTGTAGLSLTLGAFLGGMILAETPYRAIVQSEIRPFRGLLLSLFFVAVGLSLDPSILAARWPVVLLLAGGLIVLKSALNALASLAFRWSVPGSLQLGMLISQGSEFAFVILSLPPVRAMIGEDPSAVLIAAVAATLALTPTVAQAGRWIAGRLRGGSAAGATTELQPRNLVAPVLIVGMNERGRGVADALIEFDIPYVAIENDDRRLRSALADGYRVIFGDYFDPRLWEPLAMTGRRVSVITSPSIEVSSGLTPMATHFYPGLTRIAIVEDPADAVRFSSIGLLPVIETSGLPGCETAATILAILGVADDRIARWVARRRAPEPVRQDVLADRAVTG